MSKKINYAFVAIPSFIAECDELTPQDKAVFLYLVSSSFRNWSPSYRELSQRLSLGNSTIRKSIIKLHLLGFITATTSIRGEDYKNEINRYKVNLTESHLWCPTLSLKEAIERCFELNKSKPPQFSLIYMDRARLEMDIKKAIEKGHIARTEAVSPETAENILSMDIPLETLVEYEVRAKDYFKQSIWVACRHFSEWLQDKKLLNALQCEFFKNQFAKENLNSERRTILREALLEKSHEDFLIILEIEKKKTQQDKKKAGAG